MRKIEKAMCAAIKERRNWKSGNTEVRVASEKSSVRADVFLHGNHIYTRMFDTETGLDWVIFSLAGWNTNTTRSRLNALGIRVCQRNFSPMYCGKEITSREWYNA